MRIFGSGTTIKHVIKTLPKLKLLYELHTTIDNAGGQKTLNYLIKIYILV